MNRNDRRGYNYLNVPDVKTEMEHANKANLGGGLFFKDHIEFARNFKAERPHRKVVLRNFPDRTLPASVDDWLKANQPLAEGGLIVQTVNEIGFGQGCIAFHEALLERIKRDHIQMNVGILGLSVGLPGADEWYKAERLLKLAADLRDQVTLILHEYYGAVVTSGFIGGNPGQFIQPELWPTDTTDITMWHVGRYRFLKKYCRSKGIPLPPIIIGEFGADYVGDIGSWLRTLPSDGGPYDSVDGWRDLVTQWRRWWPKMDGATAYMKQWDYAQDYVYTDEEVELILAYARWHDGNWKTFQTNPEMDEQMEANGQVQAPPPSPVVDPPIIVQPPTPEPEEEHPVPENPPPPGAPDPEPETPPVEQPPDEQPPTSAPTWMDRFSRQKQALIEQGRLKLKYGNDLRILIGDDAVYELLGELAAMLDAKG